MMATARAITLLAIRLRDERPHRSQYADLVLSHAPLGSTSRNRRMHHVNYIRLVQPKSLWIFWRHDLNLRLESMWTLKARASLHLLTKPLRLRHPAWIKSGGFKSLCFKARSSKRQKVLKKKFPHCVQLSTFRPPAPPEEGTLPRI